MPKWLKIIISLKLFPCLLGFARIISIQPKQLRTPWCYHSHTDVCMFSLVDYLVDYCLVLWVYVNHIRESVSCFKNIHPIFVTFKCKKYIRFYKVIVKILNRKCEQSRVPRNITVLFIFSTKFDSNTEVKLYILYIKGHYKLFAMLEANNICMQFDISVTSDYYI